MAPCCRRVSVNPPVEAPRSRARRPRGSTPNASSAPSSLIAPRPTCSGPGSTSTAASARTAVPALVAGWPSTRTRPAMTRACAFSRDGASPCSTRKTSSRTDVSETSRVSIDDEAGQAAEDRSPLAQRRDRGLSVGEKPRRRPAGAVQAQEPHVGRLARGGVLARGLAELRRAFRRVEDVVHHLEGEADGLSEPRQAAEIVFARAPQHAPAHHAGAEQRARLGAVKALQVRE